MMYNLELEVDCVDDPLSLKKVALKILSSSGFDSRFFQVVVLS